MKVSEKIRDLVERAQKICYPNDQTKDKFVTIGICPREDADGFQVWFDKWINLDSPPFTTSHQGTFLDMEESSDTLMNALKYLEYVLQTAEEAFEKEQHPDTITHNGCVYRRDVRCE